MLTDIVQDIVAWAEKLRGSSQEGTWGSALRLGVYCLC